MISGTCPKCDSDNLEFGSIEISGDTIMSQEISCNNCDFNGAEIFDIKYVETIAKE